MPHEPTPKPEPTLFHIVVVTEIDAEIDYAMPATLRAVDPAGDGLRTIDLQEALGSQALMLLLNLRMPVFTLGEVMLLDGSGRELNGHGRKPDKWGVHVTEVATIEAAVELALDVHGAELARSMGVEVATIEPDAAPATPPGPDHTFEPYDANPGICRHCGAVKPGPCYRIGGSK